MQRTAVGIDLGTSNSVVAIAEGVRPRVLENRDGHAETPSVVSVRKRRVPGSNDTAANVLVGEAAVENGMVAPAQTVLSVKRLMGRAFFDPEVRKVRSRAICRVVKPSEGTETSVRILLDDRERSPTEISTMILRKVKEDAEFRLNRPITHAVITVPAYFNQNQKAATRKAAIEAGIKVLKLLDEPTAAAIAFGMEDGDEDDTPRTIMVFDLGGGTFDISVLSRSGGGFGRIGIEGDMWLGGDNLDDVLMDYCAHRIKCEHGIDVRTIDRANAELGRAVRRAKERLGGQSVVEISLPSLSKNAHGDSIDVFIEVTRTEFERMIAPLVYKYRICDNPSHADPSNKEKYWESYNLPDDSVCAWCSRPLTSPVQRGCTLQVLDKALAHAAVARESIDHVIMAGSSTNVPLVQRAIEEEFGASRILRHVHPKHAVALGAAVVAASLSRWICQAPDPDDPNDPERECSYANEIGAAYCIRCGTPFIPKSDEPPMPDPGPGISPHHYGTLWPGQPFNVFVKKGFPIPTKEPISQPFPTITPNQRMISIPVFARDEIDKPSYNEQQYDVFAILPPGLCKGAEIMVRLGLDRHGEVEIAAALEDGTDLQPFKLEGGVESKVIEELEKTDGLLASRLSKMAPETVTRVQARLHAVFESMRLQRFESALETVRALQQGVGDGALDNVGDLAQKAIGMVLWAERILLRLFDFLIPEANVKRIKEAIACVQAALQGTRSDLGEVVKELDRVTDDVPPLVMRLLVVEGKIRHTIEPRRPDEAAKLMEDLNESLAALRSNDPTASTRLMAVIDRVADTLERLPPEGGAAVLARCPLNHPVGIRYCIDPEHHWDSWGLGVAETSGRSEGKGPQ